MLAAIGAFPAAARIATIPGPFNVIDLGVLGRILVLKIESKLEEDLVHKGRDRLGLVKQELAITTARKASNVGFGPTRGVLGGQQVRQRLRTAVAVDADRPFDAVSARALEERGVWARVRRRCLSALPFDAW